MHHERRFERLARYVGRPALATERLHERSDGQLVYELKRPWRDGTTGFLFRPLEFLEKVASRCFISEPA